MVNPKDPGLLAINFHKFALTKPRDDEQSRTLDDHVWQVEDAIS